MTHLFRIEWFFGQWTIVPGFENLSKKEAEAIADWESAKYIDPSSRKAEKYRIVDQNSNKTYREFSPRYLANVR